LSVYVQNSRFKNKTKQFKVAEKTTPQQYFVASRHGEGGKIVLLRVEVNDPLAGTPGFDYYLATALKEAEYEEQFQKHGIEIPCLSMFVRNSFRDDSPRKNAGNYSQRCYVFVDEEFVPSSRERHLAQLQLIINMCAGICESFQGKNMESSPKKVIMNRWMKFEEQCDLTEVNDFSFVEPYWFPPVDFVATTISTLYLCRSIYGTMEPGKVDTPENLLAYESDDIIKTFFRRDEDGYPDVAVLELGFCPTKKTESNVIIKRLSKMVNAAKIIKSDNAKTDICKMYLRNIDSFLNKATFNEDHSKLLNDLYVQVSSNKHLTKFKFEWNNYSETHKRLSPKPVHDITTAVNTPIKRPKTAQHENTVSP